MMNKEIKSKVCSKCKQEKALEDFGRDKSRKDGRKYQCKSCEKGRREANKDKIAARDKAYREANKDKIAARGKEYREANKEKIAKYQKAWYEANKENRSKYSKEYQEANKEKIVAKSKAWRETNKQKIAKYKKAYYQANRDKLIARKKSYYKANKEEVIEKNNIYLKKRYAEDPVFRTMRALRNQAKRLGNYKSESTIEIVGCSPQEFWKRNGSPSVEQMEDLHIDHIIPLSWFDLSNEDHVAVSSHHSNLQYLSSEDNMAKGSSYAGSPDNIIAYKDDLDIEAYVTDMLALINIL